MKENYIKIFLEHCRLPAKIDGSKVDLENLEIPLVGISGWGSEHERNGKRNAWIHGEILSPNVVHNNGCSCLSHIEGIVTDKGQLRVLEAINDFPAYEGGCFEYVLDFKEETLRTTTFEGEVIARLNRNEFKPVKVGRIQLSLNPFWQKIEGSRSVNNSLPYYHRPFLAGTYIPQFWKEFLRELEEQGYDHPYGAVSRTLKEEREAKQKILNPDKTAAF